MLRSFISVSPQSHFPIQNLPYGVFSTAQDPAPRIGVAIGDQVLDLRAVSRAGLFSGPLLAAGNALEQSTLNAFMALGRPSWVEARSTLQRLLSSEEAALRDNAALRAEALVPQASAQMHLPASIGDYTDFYCSKEHAVNCGVMFRGKESALNPNWLHLPVAYHGRASSIVVSGTGVRRPRCQVRRSPDQPPSFEPSSVVDFELEMGCLIGPGNALGTPIAIDSAQEHMFGFVLVNDWSARDTQRWEMVPLGPFASKNWATTISPWVVTLEALEQFQTPAPLQDPAALPYLQPSTAPRVNYDIDLQVAISPASSGQPSTVTRSNMRMLYWTVPQMIAHHTAGGCNLRPGDLIATGTLSSEGSGRQGCLLELSWSGQRAVQLADGEERKFLEDGDEVTLTGCCQGEGYCVGFGECSGKLLPAV